LVINSIILNKRRIVKYCIETDIQTVIELYGYSKIHILYVHLYSIIIMYVYVSFTMRKSTWLLLLRVCSQMRVRMHFMNTRIDNLIEFAKLSRRNKVNLVQRTGYCEQSNRVWTSACETSSLIITSKTIFFVEIRYMPCLICIYYYLYISAGLSKRYQ